MNSKRNLVFPHAGHAGLSLTVRCWKILSWQRSEARRGWREGGGNSRSAASVRAGAGAPESQVTTKTLIRIFSEIVFENLKWGTSYQTPKKLWDGERKYHAASIKGRKIWCCKLQSFKSLSIIKPHIFLFSLLNFNVHIEFFFYTDKLSKNPDWSFLFCSPSHEMTSKVIPLFFQHV